MFGYLPTQIESALYHRKWITLLFLVLGALWVLTSDMLLAYFLSDPTIISDLQLYKGWLFVLCSAVFLYLIMRWRDQKLDSGNLFIESILDTAEVGISVTDEEGRYVLVNQTYCDMFEFDRGELIGQPLTQILPDQQHEATMKAYHEFMQFDTELPTTLELKSKSGQSLQAFLSYNKYRTTKGKKYQVTSITDVTELQEKSEQLRELNQTLTSIFHTAPVGIIKLNKHGRITELYNQTAEQILGWRKEEIIGMSLPAIDRMTQHNLSKMYTAVLGGESLQGMEIKFLHKTGKLLELNISAARLGDPDSDGEIIITMTDMTERNRVQDEIEKSYKENKILLQEIHHRVKNNLAIISGILQLQMDELDDPESASILMTTHNRIQSIASVHERFYGSTSLMRIDLEEQLQSLLVQTQASIGSFNYTDFVIESDDVKININQAIPFGLLMNEYVTHIMSWAKEQRIKLPVLILIEDLEDRIQIAIRSSEQIQNPAESVWSPLSQELITSLLDQLNAEYDFNPMALLNLRFSFPIDRM
jgi:PAS domain S-box-containing protein